MRNVKSSPVAVELVGAYTRQFLGGGDAPSAARTAPRSGRRRRRLLAAVGGVDPEHASPMSLDDWNLLLRVTANPRGATDADMDRIINATGVA